MKNQRKPLDGSPSQGIVYYNRELEKMCRWTNRRKVEAADIRYYTYMPTAIINICSSIDSRKRRSRGAFAINEVERG